MIFVGTGMFPSANDPDAMKKIGIVQKVRHFDVTDEIWILK